MCIPAKATAHQGIECKAINEEKGSPVLIVAQLWHVHLSRRQVTGSLANNEMSPCKPSPECARAEANCRNICWPLIFSGRS
jgi:hypothetical protein